MSCLVAYLSPALQAGSKPLRNVTEAIVAYDRLPTMGEGRVDELDWYAEKALEKTTCGGSSYRYRLILDPAIHRQEFSWYK